MLTARSFNSSDEARRGGPRGWRRGWRGRRVLGRRQRDCAGDVTSTHFRWTLITSPACGGWASRAQGGRSECRQVVRVARERDARAGIPGSSTAVTAAWWQRSADLCRWQRRLVRWSGQRPELPGPAWWSAPEAQFRATLETVSVQAVTRAVAGSDARGS